MKKTLAELVAPLNALAALQGIKVDPKDFVGLPVLEHEKPKHHIITQVFAAPGASRAFRVTDAEQDEIETLRMKAFNFG